MICVNCVSFLWYKRETNKADILDFVFERLDEWRASHSLCFHDVVIKK